MIVSDTAVKNRISVAVLAVIIIIFGSYCYSVLPRESYPDITIPNVFVSTNYKGVSSTNIETSVTVPIEKKIKGIDHLKSIKSISTEGSSLINIEFEPGTDIDDVLQKVKDKVDEAKNELPTDLENDPLVFEVNFSEMPIVVYSISGKGGLKQLTDLAEDLKDVFETVPGILEVEVTGDLEREIRIEVDPDKLAYYRVPITVFQSIVAQENQNTSGGSITLGDGRYQLKVPGEFKNPEEILELVVTTFQGRPVYLKDLAKVVDGFKEEESRSRLNGATSVSIAVKKRSGENVIAITDKLEEIITKQQSSWPQGTTITKLMDQAKDIRFMVSELENNILSGLVLVIVVLLFALGFRNAVLVGVAIPFSMLLSFAVLQMLGITLNMVVLFSLILALGMLVDNAIVIVENIYRYMEQGVPKIEAAMKATSEVAYPVIGSTITTLAAFFPMMFWPGIMGEFMKYLPMTLMVTLASSLFVALVINPALSSFFIKVKRSESEPLKMSAQEISAGGEKPIAIKGPLLKLYSSFLRYALRHRLLVLISSFGCLVVLILTWLYTTGLEKPVEFFPNPDPKSLYINLDPPEGADLEYIDKVVKKIEIAITAPADIVDDPYGIPLSYYHEAYAPKEHEKQSGGTFQGPSVLGNIEHIFAKSVKLSSGFKFDQRTADNHIGVQFIDREDRLSPSPLTIEEIRRRIKNIPGADITVAEEENGPPTGAPINIEIYGDDFNTLGTIAKKVRDIISMIPFVEDVSDNYNEGLPAIQVNIDRQKAALFNLSTNTIGFALKTAYNGIDISSFREGDEDYDISVKFTEGDRQVTDVLNKLMIPTPAGQLVPLTTLASINYTGTIGDIARINNERAVTVSANVDETKIPGAVAKLQAEELLKNLILPAGYRYKFTGQDEVQQESQAFLEKAFVIALFCIFLILVTLFNSVSQPFIIMTSVFLSLGGVFLGLTVIRSPFGIIMSGVGVISLAGVVVNNAIVLIDYTNKLLERGMSSTEAIVAAGATRLRPVLLTAITTVLGLLPMVAGYAFDFSKMHFIEVGDSKQLWETMAIVVIFGLGIATFLTLVVVPIVYSLIDSAKIRFGTLFSRVKQTYWRFCPKLT